MKTKDMLLAVGAFGAAGLLFLWGRRSGAAPLSGDAERVSGVQQLYAANTGQQAGFQQSIAANWKQLQDSVFRTQPDWWV